MITQDEALAELRNLNRQLGLPEDDGIPTPMSQADAMAQLAQLDEELATLPMTFEEFAEKEQRDQDRPLTEKAIAFGSNLVEGAKDLARQGGEAFDEIPWWMVSPIGAGFEYETIGDIINVGARDFTRFAKTLGESVLLDYPLAISPGHFAMSKVMPLPEDFKLQRAYKRYRENFDYNVKVRPAMLESGEIEYPKLVSFSANFVDPFMALPALKGGAQAVKLGMKSGQKGIAKSMLDAVETAGNIGAYPSAMALRKGMKGTAYATGLGLKGVGQAGKLTEKVAGAPRRIASKVAEKIVPGGRGAVIGGQVVGAITGAIPMAAELGIAEGLGLIAKKAGMEMGEILTTLGQPASQKRFLYRLSTNQAVSPTTRKLANYAYAMNGTAGGDALFNMVANGISAGAINAALAGLSGLSAEEAGMAGGAGFVAGGVIPAGQAGFKAGKSNVARDALSIDRHIKNKLTEDQRTSFKKLPEAAQLMLATLQESGIGAPKFMVMEPNAYLEMLNAERVEKGETPLDRAPAGHYEKQDRTIYVNNANLSKSAKVATEIAAHEVGHDFVYQSLGNDPAMLRLLLEKYEATPEDGTPFYFEYDADNNPVGDPVYLNDEAVMIASDYDRKQRGIAVGRDASKLAQEIGADQFAMMFSEDPNAFENFHPRLRRTLIDASRKLLSVLGVTEPMTGNPLSNPISKAQLNNPAIKRIFRNYGKARATELDLKGDLSEQSVLIEPKKGQTGEDRYVELFGGQGLSLRDAKNLVISNKGLVKEILAIKQRVKEEPKDTWYISKTGRLVGKDLNSPTGQEIYKLFTRNDPFGNVRNLLDALQEGVSQRIGIRFGYRSGTKGKYQNPFKIRDYAVYGFEVSPLSNRNSRPTLKVLGYDQAVVRHNIQVLAENKFIKNINDFMRDFEEQGQRALEDPEGRINPEGRKENELMTVAFGLKESAPQIANPRLRELLESKSIKKSFRGPDIEGMAGLTKGRDKALSFNYENIRDNYNPFRQASDQVFQPQQLQFDFSPPKAAQSLEAKPNFWKIYGIDPKGPRVYDEVADVLIQVGSPWMDGSIIESQAPLLGLEKGKLRQAMNRAHRRADRGGGKMFMPASEAGATKGKQAEAAKLWQEKGTDSPYFKKYSGGAKIVKIGEQHDFVSGEPVVVEGVHGSTHTFKEFDPSRANPESDLGKAIYISNTPDEVGVNYAGEGPDLTGKIERKAETYMGIIEDELSSYGLSEDATQQQIEAKSYELARNELVGEGPQTYRVFAKFKNPVVVGEKFKSIDDFRNRGGKKETNFEMMFDEDAGTESGTLVDLLEQVDEVAYDFEFVDVDKVKSDIMEAAYYESIGAQRLIETMKGSEGLMDVMDANGEFANGEFVRQVFEGMGFDGIIDLSVNEKFGSQRKMGQSMEGMNPDTIHYLAFSPEQIKSATGNRGTFDAGEGNINYMPSDPKAPKRQPVNRVQQQARSMPANRFMAPASMAKGELSERFR